MVLHVPCCVHPPSIVSWTTLLRHHLAGGLLDACSRDVPLRCIEGVACEGGVTSKGCRRWVSRWVSLLGAYQDGGQGYV